MREGRILGHEAVGIVEEVAGGVRNFRPGDRVVIPSTVACGVCSYCRAGYHAQCDRANPHGPLAGPPSSAAPRPQGASTGFRRSTPGSRTRTPAPSGRPPSPAPGCAGRAG